MSEETNWIRVYTGSDFSASLLQAEIENLGVKAQLKSDRTAGLNAGFGSSGFAQVLVHENAGWDGIYGVGAYGRECQIGTYTWKITAIVLATGETKLFVGHVNLIK